VEGRSGASLRVASVTIPKIPSEPMINRLRSGPTLDFLREVVAEEWCQGGRMMNLGDEVLTLLFDESTSVEISHQSESVES